MTNPNSAQRKFTKDLQYYKFCSYGFLKNLRLFEPFLILFLLENGISFLQIGILYSIREITRNLLEIPAGVIADSLGRKRTMVFSFSFYIISFVGFYFAQDFSFFILAMILYAIGDAFRTGTHKAMIFDYLKMKGWEDQKVWYYGHTRSWSQLGSAVSALVAAFIVVFTQSYRLIFIFSIIPYLLDLFLIISYPKELNGNIARFEKGKVWATFKNVFLDFVFSFKELKVLKAIANLSVITGYYRAVKDFLQPVLKTFALGLPVLLFMEDKQREAIVIGLVYFFIYLLTSFAARNSGRFSSKYNSLKTPLNYTIIIGFIAGILSGIFFESGMIILSILFFIGIYLIENLRKPIGISYVTETINKKDILATVLSAESQAHTIVAAIVAPLIGFLADQFGLAYAIIIASSVLLLLSPVYLLKKGKDK
ncbi:MAG: MFS transporter [Bacteroidetes bacterium]|nr:MAG: MFS transporter [Bacteroidota bacterium]